MAETALIPFVSGLAKQQTETWLGCLQDAMPELKISVLHQDNLADYKSSDFAIVANPNVELLHSMPNLHWVQSLWAGVDSLTKDLAPHVGICRLEDAELQMAMSEAVLAWTLYLHRHMHLYRQQQIYKIWRQHSCKAASDTTVAVLGLGNLGKTACRRLQNNGFTVTGWSRTQKTMEGIKTYQGKDGLSKVLASADIVVVLLPLTPATHHLIDEQTLGQMKPGASLINFARGDIIKTDALVNALETQLLNHAVLDVFATEPLPTSDPLWDLEAVTILPHISAPTNMATASVIAATNINTWLREGRLPKIVDRQAGY